MHPRGVVHTPFSGAGLVSQAGLGGRRPDRLRAARPCAVLYDEEAVLNTAAVRMISNRSVVFGAASGVACSVMRLSGEKIAVLPIGQCGPDHAVPVIVRATAESER